MVSNCALLSQGAIKHQSCGHSPQNIADKTSMNVFIVKYDPVTVLSIYYLKTSSFYKFVMVFYQTFHYVVDPIHDLSNLVKLLFIGFITQSRPDVIKQLIRQR